MKIHLLSYTPHPDNSIAAAHINMGIGKDIFCLDEMVDAEVHDSLSEIFKSHLDAPLEFASFNFFWSDIPLFMRSHLVRHRVGWGFAERSLRFYDATAKSPTDDYDWDAMPTLTADKIGCRTPQLTGQSLRGCMLGEMKRQMMFYELLVKEGVSQEDARNVIGSWYPTSMQTVCTFRALRAMMAARLSSQAHPFWQKAARQIKQLVTDVNPTLGNSLIDICELSGRCVWLSKLDRPCEDCERRGRKSQHVHVFDRATAIFGSNSQCSCGLMKPLELQEKADV